MKTAILVRLLIAIKQAIKDAITKCDNQVIKVDKDLLAYDIKMDKQYNKLLANQLTNTLKSVEKKKLINDEKENLKKLL